VSTVTERYPNLSVGIATVVSKFNRDNVYELLDFVYDNMQFTDYGALFVRGQPRDPHARDVEAAHYKKFMKACMQRARERDRRKNLTSRVFTAINHTGIQLIMTTLIEDRFIMPCKAGRRMVVMDDEGNIAPCEILQDYVKLGKIDLETARLGNIREFDYDIRKLLATDHARKVVRAIVDQKCYCSFECAWAVNILYSPAAWPQVARNYLRLGK